MEHIDTSRSRYFLYIAILFVAVLMVSNTVGVKIIQLGPLTLAGAIFIFPISYIFGDVLTEVYGYRASRKIIWSGLMAMVFMALAYWFVQILPATPFWSGQSAYVSILGAVPRIVLGSIVAYFAGEFSNSYVLSRMKVVMNGRHLWMRTIGSTIVGEGIDSAIFGFIAFFGILSNHNLLVLIVSSYVVKVVYEIVATPLTYVIINKLKKAEGVDVYDRGIDYNPFVLGDAND